MPAYTVNIKQNSTDSHQTSPSYMVTFVRWGIRDTNTAASGAGVEVKEPLIVINDCTQLTVSLSKKNHIQQASMVLLAGEINYAAAVAPGDFFFVNMLDTETKLFGKGGTHSKYTNDSLFARAQNKLPINKTHDGFKGIFKVQSVRRFLQTNKNTGEKQVYFQVMGAAFTEFNQVIYFNSYAFDPAADGDRVLFGLNGNAARDLSDIQSKKDLPLSTIYKLLVSYTIGQGFPSDFAAQKDGVTTNYNQTFAMPPSIGKLLGLSNVKRAADIFTHYVGIQKYGNNAPTEEQGLNPISSRNGTYLDCGSSPRGSTLIMGEYWNQVTAWNLINQYTNPTVNEIYTTFKLIPEGKIVPSVVFRQKPFTSDKFASSNSGVTATKFSELPRWKIAPELIYSYSFGRDEATRINFVQVIGKSRVLSLEDVLAWQQSQHTWKPDNEDIRRNGLRPYITVSDFDFPTDDNKGTHAPTWTALNYDWLNNGHLKENGVITTAGIEEPIAVGDNVEIDGNVYHIEDVTHSMSISPDGHKNFETNLRVSFGVSLTSNSSKQIYPEDTSKSNMDDKRQESFNRDGMMPGVSDLQEGSSQAQKAILKDKNSSSSNTVAGATSKAKEKLSNILSRNKLF